MVHDTLQDLGGPFRSVAEIILSLLAPILTLSFPPEKAYQNASQ